jgi:hypothetical protein
MFVKARVLVTDNIKDTSLIQNLSFGCILLVRNVLQYRQPQEFN